MPRLRVVSHLEALPSLRPEWEELEAASGLTHPFLTFAWTSAWLRNFRPEYQGMAVIVAEDPGRYRGIVPLVRRRRRIAGVPLRVLELAGGDDASYKGFLVEGDASAFLDRLLDFLVDQPPAWDVLVLDSLPRGAVGWSALTDALERRSLLFDLHDEKPTPYLALPDDYEAFHDSLKKNLRKNLSRRGRRAEELGISMERWSGAAVRPEQIREAQALERRSWKSGEGLGAFVDDRHLGLHLDLLSAEGPFEVDMAFLRAGGRAIAFQYGFVQGDRYFAYNTSYDPEYHGVSPGMLLMNGLVRELIPGGVRILDFLVGDDPYKRDWTSEAGANEGATVYRVRAAGRLARALRRVRGAARDLRAGLRREPAG